MMISDRAVGLAGYGDADADFCQGKYGSDPILLAKCQSRPLGPLTSPPNTDAGRAERGLPAQGIVGGIFSKIFGGGSYSPGASAGASNTGNVAANPGIFGVPNQILLIGGGVMVLGIGAAVYMRKQKQSAAPRLAGYKRNKRRRHNRRRR